GVVHVYGGDDAIAEHRAKLPEAVVLRAHGPGLGVAVLDSEEDAAALAADVVVFDQRGCLSPRFAFVDGGSERARRLAEALFAELEARGTEVPPGSAAETE